MITEKIKLIDFFLKDHKSFLDLEGVIINYGYNNYDHYQDILDNDLIAEAEEEIKKKLGYDLDNFKEEIRETAKKTLVETYILNYAREYIKVCKRFLLKNAFIVLDDTLEGVEYIIKSVNIEDEELKVEIIDSKEFKELLDRHDASSLEDIIYKKFINHEYIEVLVYGNFNNWQDNIYIDELKELIQDYLKDEKLKVNNVARALLELKSSIDYIQEYINKYIIKEEVNKKITRQIKALKGVIKNLI